MFQSFLSALIYEILRFVSKHRDFFDTSREAEGLERREEQLAEMEAPDVFKKYLSKISGEHFLKDLELVLQVINGADMSGLPLKQSAFFQTLLEFFSGSFAEKFDQLEAGFHLLSYEERVKKVNELLGLGAVPVPLREVVAGSLRDLLIENSYQELSQAFENLSKIVADAATILVQTPRIIPRELKKEMREKLVEEHPSSFPVFQINRQLIGGFRVFVQGEAMDYSWLSKVQKLSSFSTF